MTWMMWRQHRTEVLALAIFVGVVAMALFILGRPMHALFPTGSAHCLTLLDQACRSALVRLQSPAGSVRSSSRRSPASRPSCQEPATSPTAPPTCGT